MIYCTILLEISWQLHLTLKWLLRSKLELTYVVLEQPLKVDSGI